MAREEVSQITKTNAPVEQGSLRGNPNGLYTPEMLEWAQDATIGLLIPPYLAVPPNGYGGIEAVAAGLIAEYSSRVKRIVVVGRPECKVLESQYGNVTVLVPENVPYDRNLLGLLRTNPQEAAEIEMDYVHKGYRKLLEYTWQGNDMSVIVDNTECGRAYGAGIKKIPVLHVEHNSLKRIERSEFITSMLDRYEERRRRRGGTPRNTPGYVSISDYLQTEREDLPWIGTVYNGVDVEGFNFLDKNAHEIPMKDRYLLYLGRVNKKKGVHHALEVAQRLGMKLVIAGEIEEPADQDFKDLISYHIGRGFVEHHVHGVDFDTKRDLLRKASCLLMLGEWDEPFGMVAIEAFASGTPVVATPRGALPEIVHGKTGAIVNNNTDNTEAVEAVRRIVEDGDFSSVECLRRAKERFSKEVMGAGYIRMAMKQVQLVNGSSNAA